MNARKAYWENNYSEYWKDRVSEVSENNLSKKDIIPPGDRIFLKYYKKLKKNINISKSDNILDIGVGFGRMLNYYCKDFDNRVFGVDISKRMVGEALKMYPNLVEQIKVSSAERMPFNKSLFKVIVCWAVFDATYQSRVLWEVQRLLKTGGVALITGKNCNYFDNDKKAIEAEIGARKKNHPNYFTDIITLINNLSKFGLKFVFLDKFAYRGDFTEGFIGPKKSEKFYEYVLVLKKIKKVTKVHLDFKISQKYSDTYKRCIKERRLY